MSTPIERIATLTIGTVESVSPDEIKVLLDTDAPQATALNTGTPRGFPRINSYMLIPNETGAVIGLVVWVGVERSTFPKRKGSHEFDLIDLPFPLRKMTLTPVGTLSPSSPEQGGQVGYEQKRGIFAFPSVGDPVVLPTVVQVTAIIESHGKDSRVPIGTCPLADGATVSVDPDKLFGRHVAVLGNTGSGKSCTVAGLIRWSLDEAIETRKTKKLDDKPNARFIVLDPNGEYANAFSDIKARVFRVEPSSDDYKVLKVPVWIWNSFEWSAFSQASAKTQRPLLQRALREVKVGAQLETESKVRVKRLFSTYLISLRNDLNAGAPAFVEKPGRSEFGRKLKTMANDADRLSTKVEGDLVTSLNQLAQTLASIADARFRTFVNDDDETVTYYISFEAGDVERAIIAVEELLDSISEIELKIGPDEDAPIRFKGEDLANHVEQLAIKEGVIQFIESLVLRIRMMLSDARLSSVVGTEEPIEFDSWLADYVGASKAENGALAIIDLSLIPADVLHVIIAVISRVVFESTQRYRRLNSCELPTVLVLEEAHTFIQRGVLQEEDLPTPAQMCRRTFERIAREGRKFGLGLVLSSQRPSELSPTVLAQCNTFFLHRITNDRDQELVARLVPDNLRGLLRELPSLPTRQGILLGWASKQPVLVEVRELPKEQRPESADPAFWDVWTGKIDREINWKEIVSDWTNQPPEESGNSEEEPQDQDPF